MVMQKQANLNSLKFANSLDEMSINCILIYKIQNDTYDDLHNRRLLKTVVLSLESTTILLM